MNFGYFDTKNFTLKRHLFTATLLFSVLTVFAQGDIEFIENKGQWDSRVRYMGKVSNGSFFIRNDGFTVVQYNPGDFADLYQFIHQGSPNKQAKDIKIRGHAFHVDFVGASPEVRSVPDKQLSTYNNYFIGNDQSKWASGCHLY